MVDASRQSGIGGGSDVQELSYHWDLNDNLIRRQDDRQSPPVFEYFYYDPLDRLDYSTRNGVTNLDLGYDALGNLTSKSDVGSYSYDATRKHAVVSAGSNTYAYDANGNVTNRNGSTVLWTSYDRPFRLYGPDAWTQLHYGPDRQLWQQVTTTSGVAETTTYVGELLEKVSTGGITTWKHYVEAPTGTAAVYLRRSDGTADTYYLTHDHLGSTDKVLNAAGGVVTVEESFTALGARRGSDWQGTPTPAQMAAIAATTRDGFTGHDMLDAVGLVHMRGRVYDPVIGRFLSVDPLVRDVTATQSWNGYGYVEGRALSATDPSGYKLEIRVIDGVETIIGTESRLHLSCIICDVDLWQEMRSRLPTMDFFDQLGGPGGFMEPGAAEAAAPQENSTNCVNPAVRAAQAVVGSIQVVAGVVQTTSGIVQAGAGLIAAPETGGVSLLAVPGGIAHATLGSASVIDGGMLLWTAWEGSGNSYSVFDRIGGSIGGDIGAQTGSYFGFLGQVIAAGRSPPTTSAAAAANAAMMVASNILPSAGAVTGCGP